MASPYECGREFLVQNGFLSYPDNQVGIESYVSFIDDRWAELNCTTGEISIFYKNNERG